MATAAERLREAQAALHNLLIGGGIQRVQDSNGESVSYTTANVTRLRAYIAELKLEVAGCDATNTAGFITPRFY